MIELQHNIYEGRFERILAEPMCSDVPNSIFVKKEDESSIITRTITLTSGVARTDRVKIEAFRRFTIDNNEYLQKYTFTIVDDPGKSGAFDDGYAYLVVFGGRLLKPKVSKPSYANKGIEKIKKLGYKAAEEMHENWMHRHKEEPEYWPIDANGFPDREKFGDVLNSDLWQIGFEYMEETPSLARVLDKCGTDRVGYAYFDGVNQYMDEHFVAQEEEK